MRSHLLLPIALVLATALGVGCNEQQDNTPLSRTRVEPEVDVGGAAASPVAIAPGADRTGRIGGEPVPEAGRAGAPVVDVGQEYTVNMMDGTQFSPLVLHIPNGATVYFHNVSNLVHTVTDIPLGLPNRGFAVLPDSARPFNSGPIPPGGTFVHTFVVPGTYRYYCQFHGAQGMVGTINVEQGNQRSPLGG